MKEREENGKGINSIIMGIRVMQMEMGMQMEMVVQVTELSLLLTI